MHDRSEGQVIVVGSGPAGAAAAQRLAERGVDVIMLDAGLHPAKGLVVRLAGRTVYRRKAWSDFAQHRHDESSDDGLTWVSSLSLGGLSNFWTAAVPRYAPEDFTDGARLDERYAWPVTYDDLVPYYEFIEGFLRITRGAPISGVPQGRRRFTYELPEDWRSIGEAAREYGHGLGVLPMARGRPSMFARRGTEFDSYHCMVEPAISAGYRLVSGAYVTHLEWSAASSRVDGVRYVDRLTGDKVTVRGRAVVLAAGAIDSTVILLRSRSGDFPDGLGNTNGLVGRYLHDHPREWWPFTIDRSLKALAHPVYVARGSYSESDPLSAASLTIGLTDSIADRVRTFAGGRTTRFGAQVLGTMIPTPDIGVTIDADEISRPRIRLRYDDQALKNMVDARRRMSDVFASAGVRADVRGPFHELTPGSSAHYGGTVRMHERAEFGVLDGRNRLHDVANVAVVDSSCFTTGPEKNPTLTSMALAARAADALADDLDAGRID